MPPEQFDGHPDARSDLFALGAVVFEMVTGRRAFDGATDSDVIAAIVSGETPSMIAISRRHRRRSSARSENVWREIL